MDRLPQPGESIQRLERSWTDEYSDQFGHKYQANYDMRNMRPVEELRPVGGISLPWQPPMGYIKWERPGGFRFRWDLETLASDLSETATSYYAQVFEFMTEHMVGVEIPEIGDPVPTKVLRSPIGKPPLSPAIPLSFAAGDPWMHGVEGAPVNQMLKAIIEQSATANGRQALTIIRERMATLAGAEALKPRDAEVDPSGKAARSITDLDVSQIGAVDYKTFLAGAMKAGMSMAEGASAWKAHRENLAAEELVPA